MEGPDEEGIVGDVHGDQLVGATPFVSLHDHIPGGIVPADDEKSHPDSHYILFQVLLV